MESPKRHPYLERRIEQNLDIYKSSLRSFIIRNTYKSKINETIPGVLDLPGIKETINDLEEMKEVFIDLVKGFHKKLDINLGSNLTFNEALESVENLNSIEKEDEESFNYLRKIGVSLRKLQYLQIFENEEVKVIMNSVSLEKLTFLLLCVKLYNNDIDMFKEVYGTIKNLTDDQIHKTMEFSGALKSLDDLNRIIFYTEFYE